MSVDFTTKDFLELYDNNYDFRDYIDSFSLKHNIPIEEAFTHKLTQSIAEYYKNKSYS